MEILAAVLFIVGTLLQAYDNDAVYVCGMGLPYISFCTFCYSSYHHSKRQEIKKRITMIISIMFSILFVSNLSTIYMHNVYYGNVFATCSMFLLVYFMCRTVVLSYKGGDDYKVRGTYLAFKKPKNLQGYISALFKTYGSVSLIINSKEFKFRNGILIEREHISNSYLTYKKICNVPLQDARQHVGESWRWYRNCFSVLEGIAYRANAENRRYSKNRTRKRGFCGWGK